MKQSVNLYTEAFRPSREWLTPGSMVVVLLAVITLVVAAWGVAQYRLTDAEAALAELEQRETRKEQAVERLQGEVEERRKDPALEDKVARLEQRVQDRRRLVERADTVARSSSEGFSPYLEGLARQSLEDLWLTRIRVNLMRDRLGLVGRTRDGQAIPDYLQRLKEEAVFEGRRFARFSIDRSEKGAALNFEVASTRDSEDDRE